MDFEGNVTLNYVLVERQIGLGILTFFQLAKMMKGKDALILIEFQAFKQYF